MIFYMDMTFCNYYRNCKNAKECHRPLTDEVKEKAEKWMKKAPIMQFMEKPNCHEKIKQNL